MKRRVERLLALLVATMAAVLGAVGAPAAAGPFFTKNLRTQFLAAWADPTMAQACTSRRVTLTADLYDWMAVYYSYPSNTTRDSNLRIISLGAGSYTWTDCLKPMNGYYLHTSTLDPDNPAWPTATASNVLELFMWTSDGKTEWGTGLWHS